MRRALICVLALGLAACEGAFAIGCTLEGGSSFHIIVLDAATGINLAPDAIVRVRDGAFEDTLQAVAGSGSYQGAYERPGTYDIVVQHPDYLDWHASNVRVEKGQCYVVARTLTARLTLRIG